MKLICNPSTDSASEASNIDITKHEIPAPASKRIVWNPLQIHHACQRFCNPHKPRRLPRILQRLEIPAPATRNAGVVQILRSSTSQVIRNPQVWTILTSESLSRAAVVQILQNSTSKKSAPKPSSFNDFDFKKRSEPASFWRFWLPNRSRAQAWCKFCQHLGQPILRTTSLFGADFARPLSHETMEKTQHFAQFLPAKISHVSHLRCKTTLLSNIDAARPSGNFQYSRKLELPNFLDKNILFIYVLQYVYANTEIWHIDKCPPFVCTRLHVLTTAFFATMHRTREACPQTGLWQEGTAQPTA